MKRIEITNILILCILLAISPFISLVLSFCLLIISKKRLYIIVIIVNVFILGYSKIPTGDYYRYFINYTLLNDVPIGNFIDFLKTRKDYIFYIISYTLYKLGFSYSFWAGIQASLAYIFIYLTLKSMENKTINILLFMTVLIYEPFSINRVTLAISILTYALVLLLIKNSKKGWLISLLAILTHISTIYGVLIYIIYNFSKKKFFLKNYKYYLLITLLSSFFIKSSIIKLLSYLEIGSKYYHGDFVVMNSSPIGIIYKIITNYLILIVLILIPLFIDNKQNKTKELNFLLISSLISMILLINAPIIARRLGMLINPINIIILSQCRFRKKGIKSCISILILTINLLFLSNRLRYGFLTMTYPFKIEKITDFKVHEVIKEDGSLNKRW